MKKLLFFQLLLVAILTQSCSFSPPPQQRTGWHKIGVPLNVAENTLAQCEYESAGPNNANKRADFVQNCMMRLGFRYGTYYIQ